MSKRITRKPLETMVEILEQQRSPAHDQYDETLYRLTGQSALVSRGPD
jgi:hypothetical protein